MSCNKDHRYSNAFINLPEAQDNNQGNRHICAGCAYELGVTDAQRGTQRRTDISNLPESQAGMVRHKDAYAAYRLGYDENCKKG